MAKSAKEGISLPDQQQLVEKVWHQLTVQSPLLVVGKVTRRLRQQGEKNGRAWKKHTFVLQSKGGMFAEVLDFNELVMPNVGDIVAIPLKIPGALFPLAHTGGEEF